MVAPASTVVRSTVSVCLATEETSVRQVRFHPFITHTHAHTHSFTTPPVHASDLEVCEPGWDKFQGFCYRHFSSRQSWDAAEQHCRLSGGHLLSVMTPEEQDYINGEHQPPARTPPALPLHFANFYSLLGFFFF